jgi:hypothetical protein
LMAKTLVLFFPLYFAAVWFAVTTILAMTSGWFTLMETYPDQTAEPILRLRGQSGTMGSGVHMNGVLRLTVCSSGLRVGMMRLFGPLCRDFFVPWENIAVTRKMILFWPFAKLQFGNPPVGTLRISAYVADRLARAAKGRWPEPGPFPKQNPADAFKRLLIQWAGATSIAAIFFTIAPLVVAPRGAHPPILVAILFPAIVFGVAFIVKFFRERD